MKFKKLCIYLAPAMLTFCVSQTHAGWQCLAFESTEMPLLFAQASSTDSQPADSTPEIADKNGLNLTPVRVEINPLGATGPVAWTVHTEAMDIYAQPSTDSSVIGSVSNSVSLPGEYHVITESDEEWIKLTGERKGWAPRIALNRVHPKNHANLELYANLPIAEEIVNRWWGIPIDYEANDLKEIPTSYTSKQRDEMFLREEALEAALRLIDASRMAGEEVLIGSPYRSGETQQRIYGRNVKRNPSQRSSAPPGHSEHQLGLTIDFVNPVTGRFLRNTDSCHEWMAENAPKFGFRQTYTGTNSADTGYIEEPWHWRYMGVENTMASLWSDQDVIF